MWQSAMWRLTSAANWLCIEIFQAPWVNNSVSKVSVLSVYLCRSTAVENWTGLETTSLKMLSKGEQLIRYVDA